MNNKNITKENLTDIVFENRFKKYGAYFLRKSYDSRLITAFIIGLSLMLLLISSPLIAGMFTENPATDTGFKKDKWLVQIVEIEKKDDKVLEAEEPKKKPQPKPDLSREQTRTKPVKGVDFNVKPTDKDSLIIDNLVQDGTQVTGDPKGDTTDTGEIRIVRQDTGGSIEPPVHTVVEVMPKAPYDPISWLASNYKIPACALEMGIQGTVYVEFIVDENGNIGNVEKKNEIGCGCGDRAVETVKRMPPWSPGMQGGQAVKVRFTIPIKIKVRG